ncbi:ammonium transporter [Aeromicrobium terrae]|uniref:Ammonium transporter n=1 Tax=Aeromicrobium terrae TaxID=2498846 RepID=A0A5C8NKZ8_9ACTN|nr:ammonium transporter [Aeromicrobium terrae]TXL61153.1 ammonium transporter [Aeromicrobium terrae]
MDTGDTAWMLASTALVLLMAPGLAFFYGGMVRAKSVLNMMMMTFYALAVAPIVWFLWGYSGAFGDSVGGLFGGGDFLGLKNIGTDTLTGTFPTYIFVIFQMLFGVITVALISGAVADRAKFVAWAVFVPVWLTIVYVPVAHWVFAFDGDGIRGGWIANDLKAFDFAGGTAVEVNSGMSALALAIVVGRRVGWKRDPFRPHSLPAVLLGAGLLWFGWYGFNAGSALGANGTAALALINTTGTATAAVLGWLAVEVVRDRRATSFGAASGAVAGLVAATPSCGSVSPLGSLVIGLAAGAVCACAVGLKYRFDYDDSLDVVGVHFVGGVVGTILIGLLASDAAVKNLGFGSSGLFYGGGLDQLGRQVVAVVAVGAYAFVVTWIIGTVIDKAIGFRIDEEIEVAGIDQAEHLETAYDNIGGGSALSREA